MFVRPVLEVLGFADSGEESAASEKGQHSWSIDSRYCVCSTDEHDDLADCFRRIVEVHSATVVLEQLFFPCEPH